MTEHSGDSQFTDTTRLVLKRIARLWPSPCDIGRSALRLDAEISHQQLLVAMEALRDRGYVIYEAVVTDVGVPVFEDAVLTMKGRAALSQCAAAAQIADIVHS